MRLGLVVELVGKILLFIHNEISSSGEEVGTSGIVEEEGRDIGYPGFFIACSAREFDVSRIVSVDSGLEGSVGVDSWNEIIVCYGILQSGGNLVLGLGGVGSVDIVRLGERICGDLAYADDSGDSVSDNSDRRKDIPVDGSGSGDTFGDWVRTGFNLVDIESTLYITQSHDSVGVTGITGETGETRESNRSEDDEDGDDHDELD